MFRATWAGISLIRRTSATRCLLAGSITRRLGSGSAGGVQYGSGLPFEFDGDYETALEEYGPQVLSRVNFARGRVLPSLLLSASAGAQIYKSERMNVTLQADGQNLNNELNVIDFNGLFSGNAIGPARSYALRLTTTF